MNRRPLQVQPRDLPLRELLLLAAAMFVSMTIEFLPGGLLPWIASDLGVEIAAAGQLVSVFALTVVLTAAPMAQATRRLPRKPVLFVAFAGIIIAGMLAAAASSFAWLLGARVLAGLAHAAFWTVAGAYAAYLVPPSQVARAIAITAGGGAIAGIVGGPIGNALGHAFGWRVAFLAIAGVGCGVLLLLVRFLPAVSPPPRVRVADSRRGSGVPSRVWLVCGLLLVLVLAQSSFSTYLVPWLHDVAGLVPEAVPLYLLATGVAGALGVAVVGVAADRWPRQTLLGAMTAVVAALVLLSVVAGSPLLVVAAGCVTAAAFGVLPPLLQALIMRWSPEQARSMAVALQTIAINVGIGGGALVGGVIVGAAPLAALPWWAAAGNGAALVAVGVVFFSKNRERSSSRRVPSSETARNADGARSR